MTVSRIMQGRVPPEIQKAAGKVIAQAGLSVSDVIRILMTRIAQDKAIPPELFKPNAETKAAFAEVEQGKLKRYKTVDALFEGLNADD